MFKKKNRIMSKPRWNDDSLGTSTVRIHENKSEKNMKEINESRPEKKGNEK